MRESSGSFYSMRCSPLSWKANNFIDIFHESSDWMEKCVECFDSVRESDSALGKFPNKTLNFPMLQKRKLSGKTVASAFIAWVVSRIYEMENACLEKRNYIKTWMKFSLRLQLQNSNLFFSILKLKIEISN